MANATAVIPARFQSHRFPGKVLAAATGKPLIQHVWEAACQAQQVDRVIVASDDDRVIEAVRGFGGEAVLTRADHDNGTSRIAEIAPGLDAEVIVNVQGDEPEIEPAFIDAAIEVLDADDACSIATLAAPLGPDEDPADPNIVKVVRDQAGRAMYFSRAVIPFNREHGEPLKHVGLYAYRKAFLLGYPRMDPTPLEQTEKLEQLRFLEHGHRIAVALVDARHHGIDTPEQYAEFVERVCRAKTGEDAGAAAGAAAAAPRPDEE